MYIRNMHIHMHMINYGAGMLFVLVKDGRSVLTTMPLCFRKKKEAYV